MAREHYENFPVASLLLPRGKRRHVAAIYAFARQADDFADEPAHGSNRLELLADWRLRLDRAAAGSADHPVFIALADTIGRYRLPVSLLHDLLTAFEQDVSVTSYRTFEELLGYCRCSANPVGRLLLHLFGRADEPLLAQSDAVCTALQLANFWQDIAIDLDKGRCYIPIEDLERFGCGAAQLALRRATPPFVEVMRHQVARTRELFGRGAGLPAAVGGRLGFELKLVMLGGSRILDRIEQAGYDVFHNRPTLGPPDWGRLLMRAAFLTQGGLRAALAR
ncbi:MAG TPA: squalene synthase HpnC [Candidatus Polarisedimenticolia bacterium]|nr:squalene synthase HpnC [Candidatus Polarisedimenticolia bacterium]